MTFLDYALGLNQSRKGSHAFDQIESMCHFGPLAVSARSAGRETVVVEVRDGGPGLTPADAERAVERFFRSGDRDAEGFGLGLSIVREVAHALGGHLELESGPGTGTTARIVLRSAPATPAEPNGSERQEVEVG